MALFKKKIDPISERAKVLSDQIVALEAEIQRLSSTESIQELAESLAKTPASAPAEPVGANGADNAQPRLRSTAFPHKYHPPPPAPPPSPPAPAAHNPFSEPVFEEVASAKLPDEPPPPPHNHELGVRKYNLTALWNRLINNFRGPATSNPKLVNYLAAGSIQGLRPLRYEKRVARNRFIVLVLVLIAVLWGLIAVLMKRT
jgi:hypothetical protein